MYKVAVIGIGYVGLTTGVCLANFGSKVLCLDIDEEKIKQLNEGKIPIYEPGLDQLLKSNVEAGRLDFSTDIRNGVEWADIVFIAVGTPQGIDGTADIRYIIQAAEAVGAYINGYKIIVTKSTVPIGTNEKIREIISKLNMKSYEFDIVSNPEFLREGKAIYDFQHPDRVVIGTDNPRPVEAMRKLYRPLYLNEVPFIFTDLRTSELIKYTANCYLALKVAFINEIARLCDQLNANVQTVAHAIGKDGRIGNKFLHPGPGFGGSCFPKDTEALAAIARDFNMPLELVETVIESNRKHKNYMTEKIKQHLGTLTGIKIAILGLAFKSETDDMREAASITIINRLLEEGALIKVFDPQAMQNAQTIWNNSIEYCSDEYDTVAEVDGVVILTEWNQFRNLDLNRMKTLMLGEFFFDFRNIYERHEVENCGFKYIGIGV